MKKHPLVIATVAWGRNAKEQKIILSTLQKLSILNIPIIVVDERESEFPIVSHKERYPGIAFFREEGLDRQVLRALGEARKIGEHIFWIESDKKEFADKYAKEFVEAFLRKPSAMHFPVRSQGSMKQYPSYQQTTEKFLWDSFAALFNTKSFDLSYGPRIFPAFLAAYIPRMKEDVGWGWMGYVIAIAFRLNLEIEKKVFEVTPPPDAQQKDEIILYRMRQAREWLRGLEWGKRVALQ